MTALTLVLLVALFAYYSVWTLLTVGGSRTDVLMLVEHRSKHFHRQTWIPS